MKKKNEWFAEKVSSGSNIRMKDVIQGRRANEVFIRIKTGLIAWLGKSIAAFSIHLSDTSNVIHARLHRLVLW